ncbi:MAG: prepilin-type N-terminal cleavage/methylation domain-containing protein [Tenericutes bacterium]|nr:prepilin-type N-terminal cleavage/methylation domain-containing protein [Mycoplasmatota bacterium]
MKKNAFTLVELLAVIAILAILIIIALPNILKMFNNAKKNSFVTEARSIYKTAQQRFISDGGTGFCYSNFNAVIDGSQCTSLDMSGRKNVNYLILFGPDGKIYGQIVTDNDYGYTNIPFSNPDGYIPRELSIDNITSEEITESFSDDLDVMVESINDFIYDFFG